MPERLFAPIALQAPGRPMAGGLCTVPSMGRRAGWSVAGLFAGIGGIELGLQNAGMEALLLCEAWAPAAAVLEERFPSAELVGDVRGLGRLPDVDLVTAGFPCTDLSQAGRTRGISGEASGLVAEVFRLLRERRAPWVLLENVRNMLVLDRGEAMRFLVDELESLGYRWAYRLVDSRFTGVPQRRQRVILVATTEGDPREVLFADDAGPPDPDELNDRAFGFYWTEGLRGLGWARDAVPTLKGGSTIGIPSPPAVWYLDGGSGRQIVVPQIQDGERLQGFPGNWTAPADAIACRRGTRWKLVGNAVTVGVAEWVGRRLAESGPAVADGIRLTGGGPWPSAAWGERGSRWAVDVSMWPERHHYAHLEDVVDLDAAPALSTRGASGFLSRARRGSLRFSSGFLEAVEAHIGVYTPA